MMPRHIMALLSEESSPMHDAVLDYVRRRTEASDRRWSQRYDRWREAERIYRAFRVSDAADDQRKNHPLTKGVQKIIVPYGFAVMQSTLAFFMQVFTQRKPIIPVEGSGPMDVKAAYLMEVLLDRQFEGMDPSGVLVMYQWLLDTLRYGVGIIKNQWTVREWPQVQRSTQPVVHPMTGQVLGMEDKLDQRDVVVYEGNEAQNISPFDFLPDPNQPLNAFQKGEFCAQRFRRSWTQLRQRQAQGLYVGLDKVPRQPASTGSALSSVYGSGRGMSDAARIVDMDDVDFEYIDANGEPMVEGVELYGYVDPADLGLYETQKGKAPNSSTYPTRRSEGTPALWVFTMVNDARIIRAEPAVLPAVRFPYELIEINYDVHSPANFGMLETFRGPQYILSWLINSRLLNVEKTLNNEYVVDPSMVEEIDLLDPNPGRIIRLKEQAYMTGKAADAISQLRMDDVTQGHYTDAKVMMDLIQQITGANQLIMGMPNSGRRAATEVQGQMALSSGRMKMMVELVSRGGLAPWANQMAKNTQAFVSDHTMRLKPPYDRLLGAPMVPVQAGMLQGEFTFPFTEAGMPTDRLFEANTWKDLLTMFLQAGGMQALGSNPQFAQMFPVMMSAMLGRMLHAMNVKDLQTFGLALPATVVAPDEMVQNAVQQGDLVGLGPGRGGDPNGMGNQGTIAPPAAGQANGFAPADGFALPGGAQTPGVG
jgi:hypothetical protein